MTVSSMARQRLRDVLRGGQEGEQLQTLQPSLVRERPPVVLKKHPRSPVSLQCVDKLQTPSDATHRDLRVF